MPPTDLGAVVVTGASSGIGRATAVTLADAGYQVFAGVRRPSDGTALTKLTRGSLTPLLIDVTDPDAVSAAAATVARAVGGRGLAGLVNNAGIAFTWPMELIPAELLRRQYDVNVFGQVAVIQAFLPLLRRAAGRIVDIGSIGDRLTMPYGGPLTSSKWAFASITEALRLELRPWGIHVVLIEPASIHTEAVDKVEDDAERVLQQFDEVQRARYEASYRSMTQGAVARERDGSRPQAVADVVLRALTAGTPRTRYLVGKNAGRLAFLARWLPDRLFDRLRLRLFRLPGEFGGRRATDPQTAAPVSADSRPVA
jgi:NAD(P)-dependent dehydrogenase (short-subunit alcohol dehydrogenase family)